ncbi:P-loop containing nucleoside triphosphate hydrolase protein [Cokeromyces recurvatus]|uniref:P-loop containing nucleoside triphosphate hydrolase protein n=1 Tax=Cokeromyces recurvatus TaxID=90255 RepID=UPI002220BE97|nr:P-loop containing nucleoside triphosphate hydrolase protein [Cokeromyces recurvatus]KAI7904100.1 P-loop containing nucleoside triphosphate hydrolase protein [Cokeromyces recurvatus]
MSILLLETLKKAELEQYFPSFSLNGITQLEALAQLSMQDYGSFGITSITDRKKLFQLVQSLRHEIPTVESGLIYSFKASSSVYSRSNSKPPSTSNSNISSLPIADFSNLSITSNVRRGSGQPSLQQTATVQIPSRTRSRTLPSSDYSNHYLYQQQQQQQQHSDFLKTSTSNFMIHEGNNSDNPKDSDKCEIRRGSGPLLDSYGIPIQNKIRYNSMRHQYQHNISSSFNNNLYSASPSSYLNNNTTTTTTTTTIDTASSSLQQQQHHHHQLSDLNQKIRVCVRKRPLNRKELERNEKDIAPTVGIRSINVNEPKMKVDLTKYIEQHNFTFDDVFDSNETNERIYQRTAQPLVKYIFEGGKATCFAYGQTGSGKTYTMLDSKLGLYVLAARDVFSLIRQPKYKHLIACIGFYEIYQGHLYDLLNDRKKLFAREDGKQNVVIVGLKEFVIENVEDLMQVFEYGSQARSTGSTGANSDSSRSHAVLQILLRPTNKKKTIIGKLSFIDLAGSERGADRGDNTDMKTRMEGAEINKSLLALKECIRALDQDKRHTPFRQSKLTQVLKDSFVGNSRTCMIATISPNQSNSEHTLNTLRYADRVKELKGEKDRRLTNSNDFDSNASENNTYSHQHRQLSGDFFNNSSSSTTTTTNERDYIDCYADDSDDSDLYNNIDDEEEDEDLLLHEENFPNNGDDNILDKDFPHEKHNSTAEINHQQYYQHTSPVNIIRHPLDNNIISSSPECKLFYNNQPTKLPQLENCLFFDPNTIDSFVKFHRTQIREVSEYSKRETRLLANLTLSLSSRRQEDNNQNSSLREELKMSSEFIGYLDNLDEVLEKKTAVIEALRDKIRYVLGEEEI